MAPEKDFSKGLRHKSQDGRGLTVAIIYARWNEKVVQAMKKGAIDTMVAAGVCRENILEIEVAGSYELPFTSKSVIVNRQAAGKPIDAVISLGCLVKGQTMHFEYICEAVTQGLTNVGLSTGVPVIFGVLTVLTEEQAEARAGLTPKGHNHGIDYGLAAIEMSRHKFKPIAAKL